MGVGDGGVVFTTKVVDHGPDDTKWNLVVTGDGFTLDELGDFVGVVDDFVAFLQTSDANPISASLTWDLVNVHRIDVVSDESGADSPNCDGSLVATYFDSEFCVNGIDRALFVDDALVISTADAEVPEWDAVIVFVNSTTYGGAATLGGGVAAASLNDPNWTALHELGHAGFNLHDEYCVGGVYTGAEPVQANITASSSLATLKWATRVTAGTPVPTTTNPDQSGDVCDFQPIPVAAGSVGLFEGAAGYAVGMHRSEYDCLMRTLHDQWCGVCASAVVDVLWVQTGASPCWVATAVYGDRRHPDVVALRGWRDRHLAPGASGVRAMRLLVALYARWGPVVAELTAGRPRLTRAVRTAIFQPWARALRMRERTVR